MAAITAKRRAALKPSQFALPAEDGYPVDTPGRARSALQRASQFASPAEKTKIRAKVAREYPDIKQSKGPQGKNTGNPAHGRERGSNGRIAGEIGRRLEARDRR
jgi:hypothetical protein